MNSTTLLLCAVGAATSLASQAALAQLARPKGGPIAHTYSIVARDPVTGDMGVAVQSPSTNASANALGVRRRLVRDALLPAGPTALSPDVLRATGTHRFVFRPEPAPSVLPASRPPRVPQGARLGRAGRDAIR